MGAKAHGGCALVTPAFPETGRTVYLGHLFVGSTPLNESPLKDHPLNPMHDSNLVRVLQRQSKGSVGLIDLMTVEQGSEAVSRARAELSAQGYGTAIVDAVFERDLEALGDAAAESAFSVGASGLGLGLARALARGRSAASHAATLEAVGGRAAILAGSCSRATLEQIAAVENEIPVLRLSTQKLIEDAGEIDRALGLGERAHRGGSRFLSPRAKSLNRSRLCKRAMAETSLATRSKTRWPRSRPASWTWACAGSPSREAKRRAPRSIGWAFRRSVSGLKSRRACRSCARSGARAANLQMALKSGNFGGRDFFTRALSMTR